MNYIRFVSIDIILINRRKEIGQESHDLVVKVYFTIVISCSTTIKNTSSNIITSTNIGKS